MLQSTSNIRVFVQWSEQTVFAGEDIECQITFKNIAAIPSATRSSTQPGSLNGFVTVGGRNRKNSPLQTPTARGKNSTSQNSRATPSSRGHRSTLSLNMPIGSARSSPGTVSRDNGQKDGGTEERSHKRSVSIISLGISDDAGDEAPIQRDTAESSRRPSRGHIRASSLQIVPRRSGTNGTGPLSAPFPNRSMAQTSTYLHAPANIEDLNLHPDLTSEDGLVSGRHPGIASLPNTPAFQEGSNSRRKGPSSFPQNFKFPASPMLVSDHRSLEHFRRDDEIISPRTVQSSSKLLSPRSRDDIPTIKEQSSTFTKIISPASNGETPRSSGEFYSLSNNSTETLASEYLPQQTGRNLQRGMHARRISNIATTIMHKAPEILMMGYAQIHGSFTLDGSLIDQAPFEEVKRKSVLGGQGGGVVGIETSKRDSGLLRGFGWGAIGESLGGLLGGGELSSIKDMRGIASSKSVPLLSTPQSILFVDLRLAPGESRSYNYAFRLPRGLPPSHRGKAIKILYNLVIGTQRPGGTKEQQVKSVEVPFRILGSVNGYGELLGHDLMSPYIILRDQARIRNIESAIQSSSMDPQYSKPTRPAEKSQSSQDDFLAYIDDLLAKPLQNLSLGLLSPTETRASRRPSFFAEPSSAKEAIDLAILRSNLTTDSQHSANRFEISRSGKRVAVIMLTRPIYRLGETISAAVEFTGADIPCYALHATLETSERVDSAIALRSDASIRRVTRKIYSSHSEATLFASRIVFAPTVPSTATPSFITSGVSLDWKIVIEFVTPRSDVLENSKMQFNQELIEEISRDDRGIILAAVEGIECETFEVVVPLRVYGALIGLVEKEDEVKGHVV